MGEIDRQYLETLFYGSRRMKAWLEKWYQVSRKRVKRLMRIMKLRAIYRRPGTSRPAPERRIYPYLSRKTRITRPNQVWAADITCLTMAREFLYLVAVMDWHSRSVVGWRLSNILEADFRADVLTETLGRSGPEVFNTDQGSQFTSGEFIQILQDHAVKIRMDGKGRYADNIFVERLWRTVKYEKVYLKAYASEARRELGAYLRLYNDQRHHQALGYRTLAEVFHQVTDVGEEGTVQAKKSPIAGRWYHWQEQRDSRLIPPQSCPNNRVHFTSPPYKWLKYKTSPIFCCVETTRLVKFLSRCNGKSIVVVGVRGDNSPTLVKRRRPP